MSGTLACLDSFERANYLDYIYYPCELLSVKIRAIKNNVIRIRQ